MTGFAALAVVASAQPIAAQTTAAPLTCRPAPASMANHGLVTGSFRRISGTIVMPAEGGVERPMVAIQAISTARPYRRITLLFANQIPLGPNGRRVRAFNLTFMADGDENNRPSAPGPLRFVNFGRPVHFIIENHGSGRFSFQVDSQDPDSAARREEGVLDATDFPIRDVSFLCVGAAFELGDLQIER